MNTFLSVTQYEKKPTRSTVHELAESLKQSAEVAHGVRRDYAGTYPATFDFEECFGDYRRIGGFGSPAGLNYIDYVAEECFLNVHRDISSIDEILDLDDEIKFAINGDHDGLTKQQLLLVETIEEEVLHLLYGAQEQVEIDAVAKDLESHLQELSEVIIDESFEYGISSAYIQLGQDYYQSKDMGFRPLLFDEIVVNFSENAINRYVMESERACDDLFEMVRELPQNFYPYLAVHNDRDEDPDAIMQEIVENKVEALFKYSDSGWYTPPNYIDCPDIQSAVKGLLREGLLTPDSVDKRLLENINKLSEPSQVKVPDEPEPTTFLEKYRVARNWAGILGIDSLLFLNEESNHEPFEQFIKALQGSRDESQSAGVNHSDLIYIAVIAGHHVRHDGLDVDIYAQYLATITQHCGVSTRHLLQHAVKSNVPHLVLNLDLDTIDPQDAAVALMMSHHSSDNGAYAAQRLKTLSLAYDAQDSFVPAYGADMHQLIHAMLQFMPAADREYDVRDLLTTDQWQTYIQSLTDTQHTELYLLTLRACHEGWLGRETLMDALSEISITHDPRHSVISEIVSDAIFFDVEQRDHRHGDIFDYVFNQTTEGAFLPNSELGLGHYGIKEDAWQEFITELSQSIITKTLSTYEPVQNIQKQADNPAAQFSI